MSGVGQNHCTKEWTVKPEAGLNPEVLVAKLKWWCATGDVDIDDRKLHMLNGRTANSLFPGVPQPTEEKLSELRKPSDDRATARGRLVLVATIWV